MRDRYTWLVVAVASSHGTPIENAHIEVGPAAGGRRRALGRTDATGRTAASHLTPGDHEVRISAADGVETWRVVHLEPGRNAVSLMLDGSRRRLAGDAS